MDSQDVIDINTGAVDSRTKRNRVTHPTYPLERTYCAFCAKPHSWVSYDSGDYIAAQNVVVVCDECNEKFEAKLGKLDAPVAIPEYSLKDAELGFDENFASDWVENCIDCRLPMVKLQTVPKGKAAPLMETLRTGETKINPARQVRIQAQAQSAVPTWFCRKCHSLWGSIDIFWCKFRKL